MCEPSSGAARKMRLAVLRSTPVFISTVACWGCNDQSWCTTDIAQFTAPRGALAHHSAWHYAYHCSDQLYGPVRRIYVCCSVPRVCQINKCLMTHSLPLFNLIRRGDRFAGWMALKQQTVNLKLGTARPSFVVCIGLFLQLFDCCQSHLTIADHRQTQLCGCSHLSILLQHVWENRRDDHVTDSEGCWTPSLIWRVCMCVFHWWITTKYICRWLFLQWQQGTVIGSHCRLVINVVSDTGQLSGGIDHQIKWFSCFKKPSQQTVCTIAIHSAFHHLRSFKHQQNNGWSFCTVHVDFMFSTAEAKIQLCLRRNSTRLGCLKWRRFPLLVCANYNFIAWQLIGWASLC